MFAKKCSEESKPSGIWKRQPAYFVTKLQNILLIEKRWRHSIQHPLRKAKQNYVLFYKYTLILKKENEGAQDVAQWSALPSVRPQIWSSDPLYHKVNCYCSKRIAILSLSVTKYVSTRKNQVTNPWSQRAASIVAITKVRKWRIN